MDEQECITCRRIRLSVAHISDEITAEYALYRHGIGYSVGISVKETGERAFAHDVTTDSHRADYIFDAVAGGTVTPCCLIEVVEDLIDAALDAELI